MHIPETGYIESLHNISDCTCCILIVKTYTLKTDVLKTTQPVLYLNTRV